MPHTVWHTIFVPVLARATISGQEQTMYRNKPAQVSCTFFDSLNMNPILGVQAANFIF